MAGTGYDDATGWGSFNGANLLAELTGGSSTPTPPNTPTGLTAIAGDATVTLSWNASSGATSYNIYRSTISGGEGTTPFISGITSTTYTDNAVANGTTYYYEVSAKNSAGESALSGEVFATPNAPSLAITSGPRAKASRNSATITWTTNLAADSHVSYGTDPGGLNSSINNSSLVTSHSVTIPSLTRHTVYYYQVSSAAGGVTVTSAVESFRTH